MWLWIDEAKANGKIQKVKVTYGDNVKMYLGTEDTIDVLARRIWTNGYENIAIKAI